jgi:hypothetical protein
LKLTKVIKRKIAKISSCGRRLMSQVFSRHSSFPSFVEFSVD